MCAGANTVLGHSFTERCSADPEQPCCRCQLAIAHPDGHRNDFAFDHGRGSFVQFAVQCGLGSQFIGDGPSFFGRRVRARRGLSGPVRDVRLLTRPCLTLARQLRYSVTQSPRSRGQTVAGGSRDVADRPETGAQAPGVLHPGL